MRFSSFPATRFFIGIVAGLCLFFPASDVRAENFTPGQVVGFQDANGKTLFLHDFKGKPVVINLWATWCGPCVEEMPSLDKLQAQYASKGLVVLTLSEDDDFSLPTKFLKSAGLTHLAPYLDKGHAIWTAIQARGVPTTILISKEGVMVQRIEGPVNWVSPKVLQLIDTLVK